MKQLIYLNPVKFNLNSFYRLKGTSSDPNHYQMEFVQTILFNRHYHINVPSYISTHYKQLETLTTL